MDEVDEKAIHAALLSQSGAIYDKRDVIRFLKDADIYKHVGARFLCWMVQLEKIPAARAHWVPRLMELHNQYISEDLKPAELSDDSGWVRKFASQMGLQEHYLVDARERVARIMSATTGVSIVPGIERWGWVCYLVSLFFASRGSLPNSFAESMGFHLVSSMCEKVKLVNGWGDDDIVAAHFAKVDRVVERFAPEIAATLHAGGHGSSEWAKRLELGMFSEEHAAYEVMFVWDQLWVRVGEVNKCIRFLCVAHLKQAAAQAVSSDVVAAVMTFTRWNVSAIVQDASWMMIDDEDAQNERPCSCILDTWTMVKHLIGIDG